MSKVYEALLRAEMNRIAEQNQSGSKAESESGTLASSRHSAEAERVSPEEYHRNKPSAPSESRAGSNGSHSASLAESGPEIKRVLWHLEQNRLPALEARGVLVEQIRVLRSRLNELRLDRPLKSVIITSALPAEGKSFIASNLAVGLARFRNRRVLLIDADMRRGKLHTILGTKHEPGLTDYLAGQASLAEVMQQMDVPESGPLKQLTTLTFIPSGPDADNAADLSGNGRFELLLRAVYDDFDWIVIDSSPVTLVADGVNLARACDGVVLVTRAGVTKYEVAQRAQQELKASKIVGVVLNAIEDAPQVGGYYGYDN